MPYLGGGGADGGPDPAQAAAERDRAASGGGGGRGAGQPVSGGPMGGGYGGGLFGMAKDDWDKALSRAIDRSDQGNSIGEDIANALLDHVLGIKEMGSIPQDVDTAFSGKHLASGQADWGIDALGDALGLAGSATGLPLGSIYTGAKLLGSKAGLISPDFGMIDLGPDVFGGANSSVMGNAPSGTVGSAGAGSGSSGSSLIDQLTARNLGYGPRGGGYGY